MRQPKPFFRKQTQSWYLQLAGKQINLGKDEAEAWKKYHRLMEGFLKGEVQADDTVANVLNRYLAWARDHRAESTFKKKKLPFLRSFGRYVGKRLKVSELRAYHVQRWVDQSFRGRSPTTQNIAIVEVQAALNWAAQYQYIERNPIAKMPKPRPNMRECVLPAARWPELIKAIKDEAFRDYVAVMVMTGARPQEMRRMEARHFDKDFRRIVFPASESKGKRRPRAVYLPDEAYQIVERLTGHYTSGPIFRNSKGEPWTKNAVTWRFQRLKKKLNEPKLCATVLRHSWAHHQLREGSDSHLVSALMGHTSGRMLEERYGHINQAPDVLLQAANRIKNPPLVLDQPDIVADSGQGQTA